MGYLDTLVIIVSNYLQTFAHKLGSAWPIKWNSSFTGEPRSLKNSPILWGFSFFTRITQKLTILILRMRLPTTRDGIEADPVTTQQEAYQNQHTDSCKPGSRTPPKKSWRSAPSKDTKPRKALDESSAPLSRCQRIQGILSTVKWSICV